MRQSFLFRLVLFVSVAMLFSSCQPEEKPLIVDETMLIGRWQDQNNINEYWRFDADHKGETWDESEDVQEGEGSHYNWSTQDDQLRLDIYGEMGQHVYYDYTVVKQTQYLISWVDFYGNTRTFIKKMS